MMKKLILLGAPGAGKGTQAERISDLLGIPIISTGNILKQAMRDETPLGLEAASYIHSGALVPDATIIGIVKERLAQDDCCKGYILDGVPRTIVQAEALEEMGVEVTHVISLEVDDHLIEERMTGRVICSKCGSSYHLLTKKPIVDGICDRCGGELVVRKDDTPEIVKARLETYHATTEPLKMYYDQKGLLTEIEGVGDVAEITKRIMDALGEKA